MTRDKIIAVDFDGTITTKSSYPITGNIRPEAITVLKKLQKKYKLLLWTVREGKELSQALQMLREYDLVFDYVNEIPEQTSRKPHVEMWIDDKSYGTQIDWQKIGEYFNV